MSKRLLVASSALRALHLFKEGELEDAWDAAESLIQNFNDLDKLACEARPANADTSERYWVFWRESIMLALEDLLHRKRDEIDISVDEKVFSKAIFEYVSQWKPQSIDTVPSRIEFSNPQDAEIFQDARKTLPAFLQQFDSSLSGGAIEHFQVGFDRAIESSVERVCSVEGAYFGEMLNRSEGAISEGAERRAQWNNHNRWIRDRFWRKPLWGQEETGISLADLYVPLRGYSHLLKKTAASDSEINVQKARVFDLQSEIEGWLKSATSRDRMRIIGGGPGSGKSSLSKKLAMSVSEWNDWRVIFVEVQGMEVVSDLHSQIGERLRRRDDTGFYENPLDWPQDRRNTLIVLDGLDELCRPGPEAVEVMKSFVQGVKDILFNRRTTRVVLLGRTDAARDALKASLGGIDTLLNVIPLSVADHNYCRVSTVEDIAEGCELLEIEQREIYWKNWCLAKGDESDECRLIDSRFGELSYEPVLAYLLVLSGRLDEGADFDEVAENRNVVYRDVLQRLLPRDWGTKQHPGTEGLEADDFLFLLSCLGLSAWAGGGRVGHNADFVKMRDHCAPDSKDFDQEVASLKNVATQFYTTSDGAYEFVHKTFGEYLAARGIMRFIVDRLPEFKLRHKRTPDNVLEEWLVLTGNSRITADFTFAGQGELTGGILLFLRNEAALLSFDDALVSKEHLLDLLNRARAIGFPAHTKPHQDWRSAERSQSFAEVTLLASLNAVVRRIGKESHDAAMMTIDGINELIQKADPIALICLDYIEINGFYAGSHSFYRASLIGNEFCQSNFAYTDFIKSYICNSNFIMTILTASNFRSSKIFSSSFIGAELSFAFLENVLVIDSDFENADLSQARLHDADIRGMRNLIQEQINVAFGNSRTVLPTGLCHPEHWNDD